MLKERAKDEGWAGQLIFDSGDTFYDGYGGSDAKMKTIRATAHFIVEQFNRSNVAALVIGDRDLKLGIAALRKLRKKAKFPFLAANLHDERNQPIFEERVIKEVAGLKIGIFGITSFVKASLETTEPGLRLVDPLLVARRQVELLRAEGADVIVALTHVRERQDEQMAEQIQGIDVILSGGTMKLVRHPVHVSGTFIAGAYSKGKYVSILTLNIHEKSKAPFDFIDRFKKDGLIKKIQQGDARIATYARMLDKRREEEKKQKDPNQLRIKRGGVQYYETQLVKLRAEKHLAQAELDATEEADPNSDFVAYELVSLAKTITHDDVVEKAILKFRRKHPKPTRDPRNFESFRGTSTGLGGTRSTSSQPPRASPRSRSSR